MGGLAWFPAEVILGGGILSLSSELELRSRLLVVADMVWKKDRNEITVVDLIQKSKVAVMDTVMVRMTETALIMTGMTVRNGHDDRELVIDDRNIRSQSELIMKIIN